MGEGQFGVFILEYYCHVYCIIIAKEVMNMTLSINQLAPDFTLPSHLGKSVTLSDLQGKAVVLAFFPLAWTPI
jgi:cytochrome oxidase Cu insertion factor (SCO1/SenC/PrrC family)